MTLLQSTVENCLRLDPQYTIFGLKLVNKDWKEDTNGGRDTCPTFPERNTASVEIYTH